MGLKPSSLVSQGVVKAGHAVGISFLTSTPPVTLACLGFFSSTGFPEAHHHRCLYGHRSKAL